jgi:hypothetical protein
VKYNERYSKVSSIQLGDLEKFVMALGVVDDYLVWLNYRGWLPGSGPGIQEQVHDARQRALKLYHSAAGPFSIDADSKAG